MDILSSMARNTLFKIITVLFILSLVGNIFLSVKIREYKELLKPAQKEFKLLGFYDGRLSIDLNIENSDTILHYRPLREEIEKKLASLSEDEKVGIYLQDALSGAWLGINEKDGFVPASLLKIPIAMAIFKKVENGELVLSQKIKIEAGDIDNSAGVAERFKAGEEKSISELLKLMIKISDNTAKNILKRQLLPEEINEVFVHVGIPNPYVIEDENQLVTPRAFSRLFKALYFSTFLSADSSEKLLELSTETRVESLIAASVPWEIQVAHKYGERFDLLHDCGIVYHQSNPYFLCFMTSNIDLDKARDLIKDISKEIYEFVSNPN